MARAKAQQKKASKRRRRGKTSRAKHYVLVEGKLRPATLVLKKIYCKTCRDCKGHGPYRYLVWREGRKLTWKYDGPAD